MPTGLTPSGTLQACGWKPNCVCSQQQPEDARHFIEPLKVPGPLAAQKLKLEAALSKMERVNQVKREENYWRFEFQSKLFKFVDDVEFLFAPDQGLIHVRSASRVGIGDMDVNRKRVEAIRAGLGA
ncbi:MAG: DUF1499 domain-containing protein [Bdellovibrionota bacterium]